MVVRRNNVGKIIVSGNFIYWTIENFFNLPNEVDTVIWSRQFHFANRLYNLFITPRGWKYKSEGWFGMGLVNLSNALTSKSISVRFGFIKKDKEEIFHLAEWNNKNHFTAMKIMSCSEFEVERNQLVQNGTLHLFCLIRDLEYDSGANESAQMELSFDDSESITSDEDEASENISESEDISDHQNHDNSSAFSKLLKEIEKMFGSQNNDLVLQAKGICTLLHDMEELMLGSTQSDVTLRVNDREFKAHQVVLAARSPVFSAMLEHGMKEKVTGIVDIEDVDAESFPDFLHYLYTGTLINLTSSQNILNLYITADKYQVDKLKELCVKCLLKSISLENFCEIMTLSLKYGDKELIDGATQFFVQKPKDIIMTAKWQAFINKNAIAGNELFLKVLEDQNTIKF